MRRLIFFLFFIAYFTSSFGQNQIKRDPDSRKDFANVYYNSSYTLFDLWSDEPIFPSEDGRYNIFYATNENKIPRQIKATPKELEVMGVYKFKNYSNCNNWCKGIPYEKFVSQKNSTSNNDVVISQCNYKLSIPVIKWQFKDNRKLCKYCRAKYSICTKANLEESKAINTVKLIQIRMDKHFRSINADDVHIDYDQARLMKFMKNNNYGGVLSGANMLMGSIVDKLATAFGVDPEIGINEIELYNIKSEFCSLKCQDDYRRYR